MGGSKSNYLSLFQNPYKKINMRCAPVSAIKVNVEGMDAKAKMEMQTRDDAIVVLE